MEQAIHYLHVADQKFSKWLYDNNKHETFCTWIEWTIHGFPWFVFSTLGLIVAYGKGLNEHLQFWLLLLNIGLYLDLILIAIIKFNVQRERPVKSYNHLVEHTVDVYSFPSGHCSRAAMIIVMTLGFYPYCQYLFMLVPIVVGLSRVALGRHYISDIIAGIIIGIMEGLFILRTPIGLNAVFRSILK